MNEVQIFENEKFGSVRTVEINNEPWFVGKDVAKALGYGDGKSLANAVANHVEEEDKGVTEMMTPGGKQNLVIVNESGLYSLIFGSKLDSAKEFKHWVTSVVLPSIRKTGSYTVKEVQRDSPLDKAKFLHEMAKDYSDIPDYKQILDAYAVKEVVGTFALPLPEASKEDFSAGDLGKMLGVTANKIGSIANKHGIKTEEFGHWVFDKSPYSAKQVRTFRYYKNAVDKIKNLIGVSNA